MSAIGPDARESLVQASLNASHLSRRAVLVALLRSTGVVAITLVIYAVVPIREETAWAVGGIAAVGLLVVGVVFVRQLGRISAAVNPLSAAVESLALVFGMFLALFAFVYASLTAMYPESFTQPMNKVAAVYFSVTILATVGFGDIAPVTDLTRIVVTVQMVLDLVLIGAAVKLLGASAKRAVDARLAVGAVTLEAAAPLVAAPAPEGGAETSPMSHPPATLPNQVDQDPEGRK